MKSKGLLIAVAAAALLATSLLPAHAYATMFHGTLYQGQWDSKHLSLGSHAGAWTRVRVDISNYDRGMVYHPEADFDIYLVDQWGRCRAAGTRFGSDSINVWMPGTHCRLYIRCAHNYGTYECKVAVENSPIAP